MVQQMIDEYMARDNGAQFKREETYRDMADQIKWLEENFTKEVNNELKIDQNKLNMHK